MSAREIITTAMCDAGLDNVQDDDADYLLTALEAAGYRLLPPGRLDRETIEKCAEVAEGWETHAAGHDYQTSGNGRFWDAGTNYDQGRVDAAANIRALGAEK